jgi:superfamily II DNA or RNA helicase
MTSAHWQDLFDAARDECPSGLWAKGLELARADAVRGEEILEDGARFRVRAPGRPIAPTVSLYPGDEEWDCDCGGRFAVCEHAAAALIAVQQHGVDALFESEERNGFIRYILRPADDGLRIARELVDADGKATVLSGSIGEAIQRGRKLPVEPTHTDLALDRLLLRGSEAPIAGDRLPAALKELIGAGEVVMDGRAMRTSSEPLLPRARVEDAGGDGVVLTVEVAGAVEEILAPGLARCGDTLRPLASQEVFGRRWEKLPLRRVLRREELAELATKTLPELERQAEVEVRTERLPRQQQGSRPWLRFDVDMVDGGIDALALLVYGDPPIARIDGGRLVALGAVVPERREDLERRLIARLRDDLNLVPGRRVHFAGADAARVLEQIERFETERPGTKAGERTEFSLHDRRRPHLEARLEAGADGELGLWFQSVAAGSSEQGDGAAASPGGGRVDAETVVSAWRDGLSLVPLSDGGFASIPAGWLEKHGHLVADLLEARRANDGTLPAGAAPMLAELYEELEMPPPPDMAGLRALLASTPGSQAPAAGTPASGAGSEPSRSLPPTPPCPDFTGELRPYQSAGVAWLARLRDAGLGAVLADDMGLGKTVQALCVLTGRSLVVCPRSVIHNWTREAARFRPTLSVSLYHGPGRELDPAADVTLTTWATLRNDIDILGEVQWDAVVLDEAQAIKNPDSQTARAAYSLKAGFRLSLSGTPVENRLDELWSQMHFVHRGLLGGRRSFAERYERPMTAGDAETTARLRKRIRPFMLRRLKREVATELPPRTDAVLHCELEGEERAVYDAVRAASRADVVRSLGAGGNALAALEALLRLRQAACHPALLPDGRAASSSKVDALVEALDDVVADGHKALVFSQWTKFLDLVEPHLGDHGIAFGRLDGSTRDRAAVVDEFQSEDGPPVLLVSLTAGGTGLNLTAADHVFLLDPWWNPAVEDQAADRAHRIGQDRPVMVYRMVAKDTVEERILDLQAAKRRIAEAALSGVEAAGAASLTREDILALLD